MAKQCPKGQFYRVSKKECVDKADAAKLGIYHGRAPKHGPVPNTDKAAPEKPDESAPEPASAEVAPPSPPPEAAQPPEAVAAPPPPSPYGELATEEFAKEK